MMFRRFLSSSTRLLNQSTAASSSSAAAKRLPRLTLYTGGPECSLCEIAKQDLQIIRYTHPFDLETFNIHEPPASVDPVKAEEIRDLYKFDIPILHIDDHYLQKHRINSTVLKQTLVAYDPTDPDPRYSENVFRKDPRPVPGIGKKKKGKGKRLQKARAEMKEAEEREKAEKKQQQEEGESGVAKELGLGSVGSVNEGPDKVDLGEVGQAGSDVSGRGSA